MLNKKALYIMTQSIEWLKVKSLTVPIVAEDVEEIKPSYKTGGTENSTNTLKNTFDFLKYIN